MKMTLRVNKACRYFPCHKELEDCTFCYCPFYPCRDERMGMYVITKDNRRVWSCEDCNWIHEKKTVDNIFRMIRKSRSLLTKSIAWSLRSPMLSRESKNGAEAISKKRLRSLFRARREIASPRFAGLAMTGEESPRNDPILPEKTGVIILGHGSRVRSANDTVRKIAKYIKNKWRFDIVEPAYLQFSKPNLRQTIGRIVDRGFRNVVIVPFFLFMGNHVKRDIPREIEGLKRLYKDVKFVYAKNIGQDKRIREIVLDCIEEAL